MDHYAQSSRIDRNVAETNVVLTFTLKILSEEKSQSPLLDLIAFKGGTCLRKIYFGTETRFSMDLDFTAIGVNYSEFAKRIQGLLNSKTYFGVTFKVEAYHRTVDDPGGFGATVYYSHSWRSSQFKLEVSFRERPVLPIRRRMLKEELYWKYCEFGPFEVPSMEMEELIAEKIRAAHERTRSRDLYDLFIYSKAAFDENKVRSLAVLKCWNSRTAFNPDVLMQKFRENNYDWEDLKGLVRPERMPNETKIVDQVCKRYSFLRNLDENLVSIRDDATNHRRKKLVNDVISKLNENK